MTPVPIQWLDCRGELPLPGVSLLVLLAFKVSLPNHCGGLKRQHHPRHQSRRGIAGRKLKVEDKLNCQTMKQTCWTSQRDQALVSNPKWKQCCAEGGETRIRWFGYIWIGLEFGVRLAISCVEMASAPEGAGRAFEASCWGGPRKRRKDMHRFLGQDGQVWTSERLNWQILTPLRCTSKLNSAVQIFHCLSVTTFSTDCPRVLTPHSLESRLIQLGQATTPPMSPHW